MKPVITSTAFKKLGSQLVCRNDSELDAKTFISFFGASPVILEECWSEIKENLSSGRPKHLLWVCMFMKLCLPEDVLCVLCDTTKPTFRKWVWLVIEELALLSDSLIDFGKRKRNLPSDAVSSMSVDGTDFKVQEPFPLNRKWMSHKYKGSALKYEVGISIHSGDIVWVHGPHRGAKHDLTIFRESLKLKLEVGEMVEADKGYTGEADWIRAKEDCLNEIDRKEKDRIRARHETCNRRFKVWSILKQEYRHALKKHGLVFRAIAGLTQMAIDNGDCLFGCEPTTRAKEDGYSLADLEIDF